MKAMAVSLTAGDEEPGKVAMPFRDGMARLASAVHIITTDGPAGRYGFTATAVCSVSDAPPTLLVCVNQASSSLHALLSNGRLCVNTLASGQQLVAHAFGSGRPMANDFQPVSGSWKSAVRRS